MSVLWGADGSLHLTVPSMIRLSQNEPATFLMLLFCTFFKDCYFLYLIFFPRLAGISRLASHLVRRRETRESFVNSFPFIFYIKLTFFQRATKDS
jgi:hypothetical protein